MPCSAENGNSVGLAHDFLRMPVETRIVHDLGAWVGAQDFVRKQSHKIVAFDELPLGVKEKTAVKVPVKGHTKIGVCDQYRFLGVFAAFRQEGIRNTMRKGSVRLPILDDEFKRQKWRKTGQERTCTAIARAGENFEGTGGYFGMLDTGALEKPVQIGVVLGWFRIGEVGRRSFERLQETVNVVSDAEKP